ncbi:MAG: YeeE/YedE family protein [Hoeflea sp.]|uniref:YeeE/YedE family protein n=1 Tax=Hoeflea sp. TaxID=1940281 RepID=UPI001DF6DDB8|nr:YeeE/YedE family protein [Hoeflea sp.]MBU4531311.1 YeeE/YedE family protein [Alphaproteobacteria bacterium]MBU4544168.1 YeeE/YedE family protein [Alphaproteobacteria bacterium]MBU4550595.1 YeeE/YedE family protein [Alphaproteobacteria bacterium]MBV1724588.1 YeeE/YedE family protein [Hoeflea sp.]MBV1760608.1 YeeE/YedE family protein [Hoeflea sp.]
MQKLISSGLIGAIFGLGIAISGMANPAKVLNFFDVAGTWDPSLIFVMGGALITTALGYLLVFGARKKPVFDAEFHLPGNKAIDSRLIAGSATFGIGWGIAGFCPGGAIPALGFGGVSVIAFTGAMVIGIVLARSFDGLRLKPAKPF